MSGRTTAELVADLRYEAAHPFEVCKTSAEAADRLAELDEMVETCQQALEAQAAIGADLARAAFDALRPPCPTCGGTMVVPETRHLHTNPTQPCPDCVDGKVSIEQLVATYDAVHEEAERLTRADELGDLSDSGRDFLALLRSVKP